MPKTTEERIDARIPKSCFLKSPRSIFLTWWKMMACETSPNDVGGAKMANSVKRAKKTPVVDKKKITNKRA